MRIVILSVLMAFLAVIAVPVSYASDDVITIKIDKDGAVLAGTVVMAASGFMLWATTGLTYPLISGACFLYSAFQQSKESMNEDTKVDNNDTA